MIDRAAADLMQELIDNTPEWDGQAGKTGSHWCDSCMGINPVVERDGILVFINTDGSMAAFHGDAVVAKEKVTHCPTCGMPLSDEGES